jgi:hypothetical protein
MRKLFLFAAAMFAAMTINATDLFVGNQHVSWSDGGLQIAASQFAAAQPGQKIVVTFSDASDGMEFKVMNTNFDHLAGSREALWISGNGSVEQFLTVAAVDSLKLHGLEIIGANFTATKVELLDGKELKPGLTVWTGFFWANEWSTLELYRDAYAGVNFNNISAIRFYSEAAGSAYVLNFLKGWGEGEKFADQTAMTDGAGYKELVLTDDLRANLAGASHWMVQYNKEGLDAFNVTDIVLVPKDTTTAVENIGAEAKAIKRMANGQVVIIRDNKTYNILGAKL